MSVLLVDNGSTLLQKLELIIPDTISVRDWRTFDVESDSADMIVLSGGSVMQLVGNEQTFSKELEFIRKTPMPIVGICFGCELINVAFGGTLRKLSESHKGIHAVTLEGSKECFGKEGTVQVYENHRWSIDRIPAEFEILAKSEHGPEAIRHSQRPIYGLQFHPEQFVDKTDGDEMFLFLLNKLRRVSGSSS